MPTSYAFGVKADPYSYAARAFTTRALTKDNWMSALKLADMWGFDDIRDKAIVELRRLIPGSAERIRVARLFSIPGWVEPALKDLAQQDTLSGADLQALGWNTVAKLMQIRENVQFGNSCTCGCNYCSIAHGPIGHPPNPVAGSRSSVVTSTSLRRAMDPTPRIREVFADELF